MNTQQENFTRQANVALLAIFQHAVDHGLPSPLSLDLYASRQQISLRVPGGHDEWLQSLVIIREQNEETHRARYFRTAWTVQLPDTGVVFTLVAYREQPLMAVPA